MTTTGRSHLIRGARVLDIAGHRALRQDILIVDGLIAEIAKPGLSASTAIPVVEAEGMMVIPGLVNSHTHTHGALGKGLGDRWTLEHLLNAARWLNGGRLLEDKYLSALLNAAELVSKGCTAAFDLCSEFPLPTPEGIEAIGRAYNDVGMRAVIAPMVTDRTLYDSIPGLIDAVPEHLREGLRSAQSSPAQAIIAACRTAFENWKFDRDWIQPGLAPSIPLHCSPEFLRGCQDLAKTHHLRMQTHLAESRVQAWAGIDVYGSTITTYLEKIGFLGPHLSVAHGVWLDDDDIKRLADHGCSVAHNPGSNLRLGSGIAAVRTMLQAGVNVGIGTDGSNCSDHQNMFEAMRLASFVSRVQGRPVQEWISTEEVGEMAIGGGARMMGLRNHGTQLKAGSLADIVFLDLSSLNFIPFNDPTNQLVHSEDSSAVDSVMIGGRWVFRHRKFQTIDFDSLRRRVEVAVNRLRTDNEPLRKVADGIATYVSSFCAGAVQRPYHISRLSGCGCATQPSGFRVG